MAKLTSLGEVHRGGSHLVALTVEVDIVDAPRILSGLDLEAVGRAQLDAVLASAMSARKLRDSELEAVAARDTTPEEPVSDEAPSLPPAPPSTEG